MASALEVRVKVPDGAPRIEVGGKAVRARMFWGAPGSSPMPLSTSSEEKTFEFVSSGTVENGTMHLRLEHRPVEVVFEKIEVRDLDAENAPVLPAKPVWQHWPADASNTVGKVDVEGDKVTIRMSAPPDGKWPDFHVYHQTNLRFVQGHHYRVSFRVRSSVAQSLNLAFYQPGRPFRRLGGPADTFEKQIKLAAEAGVNFVSFPTGLPWPEPGQPVDWAAVDSSCQTVLQANPQALLLPRIPMDPPAWWCKAHPDEVMRWEDGGHGNYAVPASPVYRREAAERLAALIVHLEQRFGEHIAGYHPSGQNTGEWFYEATWKRPLNGYAPADLAAWRAWLRDRYGSDAALRQAWHREGANLATAEVPGAAERHASPHGFFREPVTEQHLIDWAEFQQEAMAGCVCALAKAAREASGGHKLVVFFYGYLFEFAPATTTPAAAGHYALRQVLDSPDINVLCSPISYFDRGPGGGAPSMSAPESVALAGKLWLNEDDTHGYLATGDPPGSRDHVSTREESVAELTRNVGQEALRNFGTWWMDLGASGWFNDPAYWTRMKELRGLDDPFLSTPTPFQPEIALVIDEHAMLLLTEKGRAAYGAAISDIRRRLGRIGAPYGQYLLDDFRKGRVPGVKLVVVADAWGEGSAGIGEGSRARIVLQGERNRVSAGGRPVFPTTDELRAEARKAGVHLFTETDCNVYANNGCLVLHGAADGPVEVDLGKDGVVRDVLTGEDLGKGPRVNLQMKRGETRVLRY